MTGIFHLICFADALSVGIGLFMASRTCCFCGCCSLARRTPLSIEGCAQRTCRVAFRAIEQYIGSEQTECFVCTSCRHFQWRPRIRGIEQLIANTDDAYTRQSANDCSFNSHQRMLLRSRGDRTKPKVNCHTKVWNAHLTYRLHRNVFLIRILPCRVSNCD